MIEFVTLFIRKKLASVDSRYLARCQCPVFYQQSVCVMYLEIVRVCAREVVIVVAW